MKSNLIRFFCLFISFTGCESFTEKTENLTINRGKGSFNPKGEKIGKWDYEEGDKSFEISWDPIYSKDKSIIKPMDWVNIKSNSTEFLFRPDLDSPEYIVFLEFDLNRVSLKSYIQKVISSLNSGGEIYSSSFYKLNLEVGEIYIIYHSKMEEDGDFKYASAYMEKGNVFYDLTMKFSNSGSSNKGYRIFEEVLESVKIEGVKLGSSPVVNKVKLDLNDLSNS